MLPLFVEIAAPFAALFLMKFESSNDALQLFMYTAPPCGASSLSNAVLLMKLHFLTLTLLLSANIAEPFVINVAIIRI